MRRSVHIVVLGCLMMVWLEHSAAAQSPDVQITGPSVLFGIQEIRIDANPASPGYQAARRVPPGSFDIDIVIVNLDELTNCAYFNVYFDPAMVSFTAIVPPGLLGSDPNPSTTLIGPGIVSVALEQGPDDPCPLPGVMGTGLLARLRFMSLAPSGVAGFDVMPTPGWTGPGTWPCSEPVGPAMALFANTTVVIGPATLSCLNVDTTDDLPAFNTLGLNPDCNPDLGIADISLRSAIEICNLVSGGNHPTFRIDIPDPTIWLMSPLPALSDASGPTFLDGSTQLLGMVHVSFPGPDPTLSLTSNSNTIKKLAIIDNLGGAGIGVSGSNNLIIGCRIGNNSANAAIGNLNGIVVSGGSNNLIGGLAAGEGNIISGNSAHGVLISGGAGTLVRGNKIGTNNTGMAALANGAGVRIENSSGHTIGGLDTAARNVISGNSPSSGIEIVSNSQNNLVQGNIIGLDMPGTSALPNATAGVWIGGAANNTIGGTVAGARNFISGNGLFGVQITDPSATGNVVQGNFIGPDTASTAPLVNSNGYDGVVIADAPANIIGGSNASERNIISANGRHGVAISGDDATQNEIRGNYIGMDELGTTGLGNSGDGVNIGYEAHGNLIGGPFTGDGNIISRSVGNGVHIHGDASTSNLVQGNLIGTDVTGTAAQGNVVHGVLVSDAPNNIIGGSIPAMRNVISDNGQDGVHITGLDATGTAVQNNFIGTTITGNSILGNTDDGVEIDGVAGGVLIGGVVESTPAGNLISGNGFAGVHIKQCTNTSSPVNAVQANIIGLNLARTAGIPNNRGVIIEDGSEYNIIGGAGPSQANVISGNASDGVLLFGNVLIGIRYNSVVGNIIGTTAFDPPPPNPNEPPNPNTPLPIPNGGDGVRIEVAAFDNTVMLNSIRGNGGYGVHIKSPNSDRNQILQNSISYNQLGGVLIDGGAQWNGIGDNNIQSNAGCGVVIDGLNTDENTVAGNIIRANATEGVMILNLASANFIGAVGPAGAVGNEITSNNGDGVFILSPANFVMGNNITGSGANGVRVASSAIRIQENTMAGNVLLGIELEGASNNSQPAPVLTSGGGGTIGGSLTSPPGSYTLEFFANAACDPSGFGEGQTFLGSATLTIGQSGSATFSASVSGSFAGATCVTATATNSSNNTSEFSECQPIGTIPPPCPTDIAPSGGNGMVNIDDLLLVITSWGAAGGPADITNNGIVNIDDLLAVIIAWGPCSP